MNPKKEKRIRRKKGNKIPKNRKGKLSVGKKAAISVLLVLYVVVLLATSFVVFYRPTKEAPRTISYTETYFDSDGNVQIKVVEDKVEHIDGNYNFLVLGHDRAAMLTDVFMIMNLDANSGRITIMQIPRDTWFSDHNGYGVPTNKINAVFSTYYYSYIRDGEDSDEAYLHALTDLAETLEKTLNIGIHASAIMDLDGFINIVDIIGGVEIDVPPGMTYNDPAQGLYIDLPSGVQRLNGNQAEGFVRIRSIYLTADLGRQNAQKRFMVAFFDQIKSSLGVSTAIKLSDQMLSNVVTDFKISDAPYFVQAFLECDLSDINMLTMPGNLASGYYVMNREATLDVINSNFNVFDKDIPLASFDSNGLFNNTANYAINQEYNAPAEKMYDSNVYNGKDVDENSIEIH